MNRKIIIIYPKTNIMEENNTMTFCTKCYKRLLKRAMFCANCGAPVDIVEKQETKKAGIFGKKKILLMIGIFVVAIVIFAMLLVNGSEEKPLTAAELLDLGEKYLLELNYEQAIVTFEKLIEMVKSVIF